MNDTTSPPRRWAMPLACLLAAFAGALAAWEINAWRQKPAVEQVVHDYVLNHPEILPEAMERLQQRENAKSDEQAKCKSHTAHR